jgi:hypothetical protein
MGPYTMDIPQDAFRVPPRIVMRHGSGTVHKGEYIADSGEGYASKENAMRARDSAIELAAEQWAHE